MLLPLQHPNVISLDDVDLDFADIFGPAPAQVLSSETVAVSETNGFIYEEPAVIYSRSHSFVGPTNYVSQSLKLSKLTPCENEHLLELVEGDSGETKDHLEEATLETAVTGKSEVHADVSIPRSVGLDDFEVLKVVGQGAFAKVYQVRKIGTSEILAMKVMRKDKILEKDHAEYMKTERDVLTKIDHPFVVRLRYSFQVIVLLQVYVY